MLRPHPFHLTQTPKPEECMYVFWVGLCAHGRGPGAIALPKNVCAALPIGALLAVMVVTLPLTLSVWDLLQTAGQDHYHPLQSLCSCAGPPAYVLTAF